MTRFGAILVILLALLGGACAKKVALPVSKGSMEEFTPLSAQYAYLEAKAKIVWEEESGKVTRGTLQLRAKKDSVLWFSLSPGLGVEAMRGLLTQEKIQIQDRLSSQDINLSYAEFEKIYGIGLSLELFQNMLWANIPYALAYQDRLLRVGKNFELTQVRERVRYFTKVDTRHGKVAELSSTSLDNKGSLLASFPKFQTHADQIFPSEVLYKIALQERTGQQQFRIYLQWTAISSLPTPLRFPFRF